MPQMTLEHVLSEIRAIRGDMAEDSSRLAQHVHDSTVSAQKTATSTVNTMLHISRRLSDLGVRTGEIEQAVAGLRSERQKEALDRQMRRAWYLGAGAVMGFLATLCSALLTWAGARQAVVNMVKAWVGG